MQMILVAGGHCKISLPHHHYLPVLGVQQEGLQTQFGAGPLQRQMISKLYTQLATEGLQLPVQMNQMNDLTSHMTDVLNNPINYQICTGNPMMTQLNQQCSMNSSSQVPQHQTTTPQMQQAGVGGFSHHAIQRQFVMQPTPPAPSTAPLQSQSTASKEFNTASLCHIGQETVQDIVSRTQEVFQNLKVIQLPNGTPQGLNFNNDKKAKIQEQLRTIRVLFKRLRLIYEKCNENYQQGMEYTHIESLILFKDEIDPKYDEKKNSETGRLICEENEDVMELVALKNKQLKEVIDHLRRIICEINIMLTMRRT